MRAIYTICSNKIGLENGTAQLTVNAEAATTIRRAEDNISTKIVSSV